MKRLWLTIVVLPLMGITAGISSPMAYAAETPLVINTTSIDFGNTNVGSTSTMTTIITNTGGQNFGPMHLFGGAPAGGKFTTSTNCDGNTLAPGGTCAFSYRFSPTGPGSVTDTSSFVISATSNQADGETFTVGLSGTGVNPLTATPLSHDFGNVNVGSTSTMTTIITNASGQNFGPMHVFGGAPAGGKFTTSTNCNGNTLAPGGTCAFSYRFSPTAAGSVTDTSSFVISATSNQADGETFTVSLSGCGVTPGMPCPSATTAALQSSVNPSVLGQQVIFTATVDAPSTPAVPAGAVKFVDATSGTTLATVTLDANGQATLTTADLAVGSHDIQATYTPSSAAFAGSIGSLTQVVKPPAAGGGSGDSGLPVTGSSLPTTLTWLGGLIIAIGIALLMLVRSRRARAIAQALPPEAADDRS